MLYVFSHTRIVFAKFTFDLNGVAEVDKQTVIDTGGGKIVDELHFMFRGECEECFDFDYKLLFDPQVRKVDANLLFFIKHRKPNVLSSIDAELF